MSQLKLYPIMSKSGVKRDGTPYENQYYISSQWTRWQRGLPRKIGGYTQLIGSLPNIVRKVYVEPNSAVLNVYMGDYETLQYLPISFTGQVLGGLVNRTPAAYVPNINTIWNIDTMYVTTTNSNQIFAHPGQNLADINSPVATPIFSGIVGSTAPLTPTGQVTSGGIVALAPYLVFFGSNGFINISNANDPTTLLESVRVTAQKIVAGKQIRGGNSSPAALFWSIDSVIRMTQAGLNANIDFRFDTLTDESSILSAQSIIEYDNRYFWIGVDKFYIYNGVVQELPNDMNINFFFDNLNQQYAQKVWATKVPRYNEIWWFYPDMTSTECNRAIVYNIKGNFWFDTLISRSAGFYAQILPNPLWVDNITNGEYALWEHEVGYDQVVGNTVTAIDSNFTTADISWCAVDPGGEWNGTDRWVNFVSIEPDFRDLEGTLNLTVNTQQYAQDPAPITYGPFPITSTTTKDDLGGAGVQGRFMTLTFDSNEIGGNYQMGQTLLYMGIGDARR